MGSAILLQELHGMMEEKANPIFNEVVGEFVPKSREQVCESCEL
jgi:hypothetical protein